MAFRDIPGFDLTAAMAGLYASGHYFVAVPAGASAGDADTYWTQATDPDGKVRDRFAERDIYLADMAGELAFIAGLTPGRVLDIGCGPGWLLSAIDPAWQRFGVEPSAPAARLAAEHAAITTGTLDDTDYGDGAFDLIVMYHVIEHMADPVDALQRVMSLLKPGGRLLLGTPDFDSGCARLFGAQYRLLHDPTHISLFSNDSMHRLLRDTGLHIDTVDFPYFETRWFTEENLQRLFDTTTVSPPFYGNFMTFYCSRPNPDPTSQRI